MIVTLIQDNRMLRTTLPEKVAGRFWVNYIDPAEHPKKLVAIEAIDGKWYIKGNSKVTILSSDKSEIKQAELIPRHSYRLSIVGKIVGISEHALLVTEPTGRDRSSYVKYAVEAHQTISVGRDASNDICFNNALVSLKHMNLTYNGKNHWTITDKHSSNGTFVNGYKVDSASLLSGDIIYVLGLIIIVGNGFLAINNPDYTVVISSSKLTSYAIEPIVNTAAHEDMEDTVEPNKNFFDRSPRFMREIERREITIDSPPAPQKNNPIPLSIMLGPSLTMGVVSLATAGITVNNIISNGTSLSTSLASLLMSMSMMLSCVLWPVLTKRIEQKDRLRAEKERQQKYMDYLQTVKDTIARECSLQSDIYHENCIDIAECSKRVEGKLSNLWERTPSHSDFLKLRVGIGDIPLDAGIKYQERHFSVTDDNLQNAMYEIAEGKKLLHDVPITITLVENYITGIIGNRDSVINFVDGLILQITALHSYDEVQLIFIVNPEELALWKYAKWLPHTWDNDRTVRFFVSTVDDAKALSSHLDAEIAERETKDYGAIDYTPYYVVIAADKDLFEQTEVLKQLLTLKRNIGLSVIALFDELTNLPKECTTIIELGADYCSMYDKNDTSGKKLTFKNDMTNKLPMYILAVQMANTHLRVSNLQNALPTMITFLEMYGVGKIEHLNPFLRWQENDPTRTLQAPIGVDKTGALMMLDLHEKSHGPHGLVAGMTGSGKSELIITYILSMAVNYHPDEVAFILIDYKGGGLAGAFEDQEKGIKLPHLAGTITNLDGTSVKRSLISIQSELRHRQTKFNEARKISNEGTMDIYKYQKLRREGIVTEPIPHLFIISDEFAELKQQQPDFMEQLISAARIGRSLGVHLILATQKPNGVVDDQIWSNSKFRVCLKVQEKADSMDMIKRPDAAALSTTGRFFLQVGFNEYFGEGQSAWSGAAYVPADNFQKTVDDSVCLIDEMGQTIREVKPQSKSKAKTSTREIVGIVKYLSDLAQEEHIAVYPLWLEPIPAIIYINDLLKKYNYMDERHKLNPLIGELDDPFNQKQDILTLPLTDGGNAIIYGATGSGVEDFVVTAVYSMISNHSPDEVNLYLLDFGAETLGCFSPAPHIGDVLFSSDKEKICNLFKTLQEETEKRKKMLAQFGGNYLSYCATSGHEIPAIVVIINSYEAFIESYDEFEGEICALTREGSRMGIYFIFTAATTNAVRYKVAQNFKQIFALQLNDQSDYPGIIGNTEGVYPSKIRGRGIVRYEKVYEFQVAHVFPVEHELETIRNKCRDLRAVYKSAAKRIAVLPDVVDIQFVLPSLTNLQNIPIGVKKESLDLAYYNFQGSYISLISGQDKNALDAVARGLISVIAFLKGHNVHLVDLEETIGDVEVPALDVAADYNAYIVSLFHNMVTRNNTYKDSGMDTHSLDAYPREVYIVSGIKKLFDVLDLDERDKLATLLEKGSAECKIHFILIDTENSISSLNYQPWYKKYIKGSDGIWVGDGFGSQYTLKPAKVSNAYYAEIGDDFGYLLQKGRTCLIKLLQG